MPLEIPANATVLPPGEVKLEQLLVDVLREQSTGDSTSQYDNTGLTTDEIAAKLALDEQRNVNIWVAFTRATQQLFKDNVESYIGRLVADVEVNPDTDMSGVNGIVRSLGFDVAEELLVNLSSGTLQALAHQLPMFSNYSSTDRFVKFIGLLLNGEVRMSHLYTNDYIAFEELPRGPLLHEGGSWFKTTHIGLTFDWLGYQNSIVALNGDFNTAAARRLIDQYVPLNLVIEYFGFYIKATAYVDVSVAARQGRRRVRAHVGPEDCKLDRWRTVRTTPN